MDKLPKTILIHEAITALESETATSLALKEDTANKKNSLAEDSETYIPTQAAVNDALALKQDSLGYTPEDVTNKKTSLSDNSDTFYPSQKAVKTAVDLKADASVLNGYVKTDGTSNIQYSSGSQKIGNVSGGNYSEFEADGTLKFLGAGTVWDDSMVPGNTFRSGVTSLTFDALTTNLYTYRIDLNDEVHLGVQLPHSMMVNTVISPHIHLVNKNAIGNTNYNVAFDFTWSWANIGSAFPAEQNEIDVKLSFQNVGALTHKMLVFSDITPVTGQGGISSLFLCRLKRVAASAQPYNTNDIFVLGFDIHFQKDTVGSRERASK